MITIKSGNYSKNEMAIISELASISINYLCDKCEYRYIHDDCKPCPYKYLIKDLALVEQKFFKTLK